MPYLLAEPRAMMLERPAGGDVSAGHRANRPSYPDRGVDVHDDAEDQHERTERVRERREAHGADRERVREIPPPDHDARDEKPGEADHHHEEQKLLARVVAADLGQLALASREHLAYAPEPLPVGRTHHVVLRDRCREQ